MNWKEEKKLRDLFRESSVYSRTRTETLDRALSLLKTDMVLYPDAYMVDSEVTK